MGKPGRMGATDFVPVGTALTRRRRLLTVAAGSLLAAGLPAWTRATAAPKIFRGADTHPADYPTVRAVVYMGELMLQRSSGRLGLQVFHSRQLGEEKETIEQTRMGAIDINRVNLAPFNDLIPESIVPALPFLFQSTEHLHRVLDGDIGQQILRAFERHGFIGLAYFDSGTRSFYCRERPIRSSGTRSFYCRERPIRSVADMQGRKFRVQQSALFMAMIDALGAEGVPIPYGQVLTALETGIVDGAENNWPSYESSGHYRVAPYYTLTAHAMAPEVLVMSKRSWDKLSSGDRDLIRGAAHDAVKQMRRLWAAREREAREKLLAARVQVITLTPAERQAFVDAMAPIYDRFASESTLRDLVKRIRALNV